MAYFMILIFLNLMIITIIKRFIYIELSKYVCAFIIKVNKSYFLYIFLS